MLAARNTIVLSLAVRCLYVALIVVSDVLLPDNDSSARLIRTDCGGVDSFPPVVDEPYSLRGLVVWDTVYFERIARCGYEFEQFHAFFPLFPKVVYGLAYLAGFRPPSPAVFAATGIVLNAVLSALSAVMLAQLSAKVLKDDRLAALATLFFILNPASVFHAAAYTESLYTFCCMAGLYLLYVRRAFWLAVLPFAASSCARSNGILNACFLAHFSLRAALRAWPRSRWAAARLLLRAVVACVLSVTPYALFQYYAWRVYCGSHGKSRPWCAERIPAVYGFVQSHYWGVGFLRYYQLKQLPNFAVALPLLLFSFSAVVNFAATQRSHFLTGGLLGSEDDDAEGAADAAASKAAAANGGASSSGKSSSGDKAGKPDARTLAPSAAANGSGVLSRPPASTNGAGAARAPPAAAADHNGAAAASAGGAAAPEAPPGPPTRGFYNKDVTVFVFHWGAMAGIALLAMHVQVSTRFLSSCAPVYWFAAHVYTHRRAPWLWWYCLYYMALGALMMPNFYPWT